MKKTARCVAFLLCVSLFVGLIPLCSGADGVTEAVKTVEGKTYIEDGLVAWYDGTNNANGIQDPQTDYWKDLTGNGNHLDMRYMTIKGEIHWTDNAMLVDPETGLYQPIPDSVKTLLEHKAYTVELVLGEINYNHDATESVTLLRSYNGELSFGFDREEDGSLTLAYRHASENLLYPTVPNAEGYLSGHTLAITSEAASEDGTAEGSVTLYVDGVPIASERVGFRMNLDYLYLGHTDPAHRWGGEIHGLRVYDRVLSAEELAANAEADSFNYRQGNSIDPVERYDPIECGDVCITATPTPPPGCTEKRMVFSQETNMIPTSGFYGSTNVLDYLYPYESDVAEGEAWEGARIMRSEENETDLVDGSEITDVRFDILYNHACIRFNLEPASGRDARYVVFQTVFDGPFEEIKVRVIGYDADRNEECLVEKNFSADEIDRRGGAEQYLILDTEGSLEYAEMIRSLEVDIVGMGNDTKIYLKELAFCTDEAEVEAYTGISLSETETESVAETDPETTPDTSEDTVPQNAIPDRPSATVSDTTGREGTQGGCASAMGAGCVILLILGLAVSLNKKRD